ncbi:MULTISPECIES: restriction endonuclease subunit S [unclassified Psychrobacter]|uniref:restriction endonuclease subunit S n=1 Tax=unclassified Psychrobacter TaxID=196806 RepID=UPI001865E2DE|nr:restriction endonuclease subunit S [Psychrobacter sp. FME61]
MASDWIEKNLGNCFHLENGFAFKSREFVEDGIPVIKIKNIKAGFFNEQNFSYVNENYLTEKLDKVARINDILVSMSGNRHDGNPETWVGKAALFKKRTPYLINQRVAALRVIEDTEVDSRFVSYSLSSWAYQQWFISIATSSGGQANLSPKQILDTSILLPPLVEQKAIAHILGSLDDKIELNRQMNETLEAMTQALFKSWFVDFDPVIDNALAAGNAIPEVFAKRAGLRKTIEKKDNSDIQALFPDEFEFTEEMGWIPKGWAVSNVGTEFNTVGGGTPSTKNSDFWENGDISWTTPKDLSGNQSKILLNTDRKITELGLNKISSGLLPIDTVLMSSRAPVGYLALAKVPVAINQGYIALKCEKILTPEFAIQWADSAMDEIKQRAGGTTFAEISKTNFRGIPILVPSQKIIDAYSRDVKDLYNQITSRIENINTLAKLRDTLLPKLMSGELRIPDAETLVDETL